MIFTLTTTHQPATDLGFLLHKHPEKHQQFPLPFGTAHVFYPEANPARCTAALVLDVDPIALVRGRRGAKGDAGLLDQYVNDRPYAVSSFLSVALRRVFASALAGRSEHRPDLAELAIPLEARLTPLRCRDGIDLATALFGPLGYGLTAKPVGVGPHWDVTIDGVTNLSRLLTHLYVLIPVLDDEKHYWVDTDEIEKLLRHGEGWLQQHPARDLITRRYLKHQKRLTQLALEQLETIDDSLSEAEKAEELAAPKRRLHEERLERVVAELKSSGTKSVLDLGCGSGRLLGLLMKDRQFERILGVDASSRDLDVAADRLHLDELSEAQRQRISLIHGALTYRDKRLAGFDAAAMVEVIEHVDPPRLGALVDAVFGVARPHTVVLTTPNAEYNVRYETLGAEDFRHSDHRFEWPRAAFRMWAETTAEQFGYSRQDRGNRGSRSRVGHADADGGVHMQVKISDFSLVVLVGATGSGKSTFAARHFLPTEIISSDRCRALVADDEMDQSATPDAFDLVHAIAAKRLARRRLAVIDATNVRPEDRKQLVELARRYHALPTAIVFDLPEDVCLARNQNRDDRNIPGKVVHDHVRRLRKSLRGLDREGFRGVNVLRSEEDIAAALVVREPLWCDRRADHGPFDIIGDVHGCREELETLLDRLGYRSTERESGSVHAHPDGRRAIFVGDLVDRGPDSPGVLRLVMDMVAAGSALAVPGNHDMKLVRKLSGKDVKIAHGLAETLEQLDALPEAARKPFCDKARSFLDKLVSHLWLDQGRLVVAHAGMKQEMQGRGSAAVRAFALFGETTGEIDDYGLPVRYGWATEYRGGAMVVYGHTPTPVAEWINNTICIDTGCVSGGKLTALRYPERDLVEVPAARIYMEPVRPLIVASDIDGQQAADAMLDIEDVRGKRTIVTRLVGSVRIEPENAAAALEVMSRFAIDPRWLVYLPPTMSPPETSARPGLLEHPDEAFGYFRRAEQGRGRGEAHGKPRGHRAWPPG